VPPPIGLRTELGICTDDFDGLMKRRVMRVLVRYSPTLFFQDCSTLYGTAVEAAQLHDQPITTQGKHITSDRPDDRS
jgi:hypothetical protein